MQADYANRGRSFEILIEAANKQYMLRGRALIQKVPTPWVVKRAGKRIVSAFPDHKSTVDFIGIAGGKSIAFDAKCTRLKTRFPFDNIEPHQYEFLRDWQAQGGTAFILVEFAKLGEIYLIPFALLDDYWQDMEHGGRKSATVADIRQHCERITGSRGVVLDYLQALEGGRAG